jgi:phosphoglycerate dehydrogenase-like enzyme
MVSALKSKRIAGAFLDVFDKEPVPADNPLCILDNVVLTPHIGGSTPGQTKEQSRIVADQLIALLDGKQPPHMLNPEVAEKALKGLA